jgi:23S rRNA pseudouridine1911/1915/1917 synthase
MSSPADDLIGPGGKVRPDAVRAAYEAAAEADDPDLGRVRFELQRDTQGRLDKYLTSRITFMSRTRLAALIDEGGVTVNGRTAKASTKLRVGDVVEVVIPPPPSTDIVPEAMPIDVLYEDDDLIVLNKQPDLIVHPARSELSGTLINGLTHHFRKVSGGALSQVGSEHARPGVVHRLDRNTTGCIVVAKTDEAHWKIARQFEQRSTDKRYLALVHGHLQPDCVVFDQPLGPHPSREKGYREKVVVRHDDLGKPSLTIARVRERYRDHGRVVGDQEFSLIELELKTGRTHQIRVHLSHAGLPIVGDDMYGGRALSDAGGLAIITRQALHAALLAFTHPRSGEPMVFVAPLPADLTAAVDLLRACPTVEPVDVGGTVSMKRFGL